MMKLSQGKVTAPGAKQVFRGPGLSDTVALWDEPAPRGTRPLLTTVMVRGDRVGAPPSPGRVRTGLRAGIAELPAEARRMTDPRPPEAAESDLLRELTDVTRRRIESGVRTTTAALGAGATAPAGPQAETDHGG